MRFVSLIFPLRGIRNQSYKIAEQCAEERSSSVCAPIVGCVGYDEHYDIHTARSAALRTPAGATEFMSALRWGFKHAVIMRPASFRTSLASAKVTDLGKSLLYYFILPGELLGFIILVLLFGGVSNNIANIAVCVQYLKFI